MGLIYGNTLFLKITSTVYTFYSLCILLLLFIPLTIVGLLFHFFSKKIWHNLLKLLAKVLLPLLFVRVKVHHRENLPKEACIFTPNQLSHLDGFIIRSIVSQPFFAITEPFRKFHPIFVFWMKRLNFVDLRRTEEEDTKYPESHSRKEGILLAANQLRQSLSLLIFPEGHFERKQQLLHFYPGAVKLALETGVPLVPLAIQHTNTVWPPDFLLFHPACVEVQIGQALILPKTRNPSKRLINQKTILLKKKVAEMLPSSYKPKGWQKNV